MTVADSMTAEETLAVGISNFGRNDERVPTKL